VYVIAGDNAKQPTQSAVKPLRTAVPPAVPSAGHFLPFQILDAFHLSVLFGDRTRSSSTMHSGEISSLPRRLRLDERQTKLLHELEDEFGIDSHGLRGIVDQFKQEFSQGLTHGSRENKGSFLPMM
jgi:hypothetical protein